ncbi:MAG: response regulator transcription factor [Candidatus Omnitrophica bacterium]|nr:response regulator transcription factor [Candidatus Omnitrophota bacterium]MBI3020914.1 response regulator transcription factor [Candidatus Omnitrophota bacterium]
MPAPKKILIADDEEQLALALKIRFQAKGYQVFTAGDGRQTLELITQQQPDLLILDILMPVMDGYTCLREINRRLGRGQLPVVILTARDRMKDLFELEGIEDYVVKPFDHEDLLLRIERVFKRRAEGQTPAAA